MPSEIVVALVSLFGTLCGTFAGIMTSTKLTNYRIEQLEKKVDKHNNFAEKIPIINVQIENINHRLDELEIKNDSIKY